MDELPPGVGVGRWRVRGRTRRPVKIPTTGRKVWTVLCFPVPSQTDSLTIDITREPEGHHPFSPKSPTTQTPPFNSFLSECDSGDGPTRRTDGRTDGPSRLNDVQLSVDVPSVGTGSVAGGRVARGTVWYVWCVHVSVPTTLRLCRPTYSIVLYSIRTFVECPEKGYLRL